MKILVTNNQLKMLGGSETFTYTMANELRRQGHSVDVFTLAPGLVSKHLKDEGFIVYDYPPILCNYNLILANHNSTIQKIHNQGFIIQTCHGLKNKLEQPSRLANKFVTISWELQHHLIKKYKLKSEVIINGIDCRRFSPQKPINQRIKKVLSLSFSEQLNQRLNCLFVKRGIYFTSLNKFKNPVWNIEDYINESDLVISLGRGCYEALSCGRPVLVLDGRKYQGVMGDGLLNPESLQKSIKFNCSGRYLKRSDVEGMVNEAIESYDYKLSECFREFAAENLNIKIQLKKYFEIISIQAAANMG